MTNGQPSVSAIGISDSVRESVNGDAPDLRDSPLGRARAGLDACVHCGFCLQSCPTYLALDDENDSPRGRLFLMRSVLEGALAPEDAAVREHISRCLGCRACETVCPSGVPYGHLLEATRATLASRTPLPWMARLVLAVFGSPLLTRVAMLAARVLRATRLTGVLTRLVPGRAGFALGMLDATRRPWRNVEYAVSPRTVRGTVTLLEGCVMDGLFGATNDATRRTLGVNGWRCVRTPGQACCGALHAHAGDPEGARRLARRNIAAFERSGAQYVVSNAAGCGAMLREYEHLLSDDPEWAERANRISAKARDATELLAEVGPEPGGRVEGLVTYDAPCHLLHAQRISDPPLKVLAAVRGTVLVPLPDADQCCGAAGIYNLLEPATSAAVLQPKVARIVETGAAFVATGNPGCIMQIGAGLKRDGRAARAVHPIDLLDASYAAAHRSGSRS